MPYNPRPSTLYRDMVCPSWWKLPGEEGQSEYAEEGTRFHDLIYDQMTKSYSLVVPDEDKEPVQWWIEYVKEKTKGADWIEYEEPRRVNIKDWTLKGTPDVAAGFENNRRIVILDCKSGHQPLKHDRVYVQLGSYGLMRATADTEVVDVHAGMPRIERKYHQQFSGKELYKTVLPGIHMIRETCNAPGMTLNLDGAACEHCPKKPICPLIDHEAQEIFPSTAPATDLMTADQIRRVLKLAPLVEKIHKAVKKRCIQLDNDGALPEGIYIKDIAGDRYFPDLRALWGFLDGHGLISGAEFIALCKLSYGNLEKVLKMKVKERFSLKTGHIKKMEELIAPFVERGEGKKQVRLEE